MDKFQYRARTKQGQLVQGKLNADDVRAAKKLISGQGLILIDCKKTVSIPIIDVFEEAIHRFKSQVPIEEIIIFNRQLQIVYSVGINIMQGLEMIMGQTANPTLKKAIATIMKDVAEGSSMFEAMGKHPQIFDNIYLNLIRVGEATGDLENLLGRASEMAEGRAEQTQKVKSAMFYPKIVLGFMGLVFLVIVYFVLPRMKTFYTGMGADLPAITKVVMGTSDFFVDYWYMIFGCMGAIYYAIMKFAADPRGRLLIHQTVLKLPVFGMLLLQIEMNTFCILLELLIKSGVSITDAFGLVSKSSGNMVIAKDIERCRTYIEGGGSIADGFLESNVFPPFVTNLLSIGEQGGSLPMVLGKISAYYKVQVNHKLDNLSKLIEPILLFFIFGLVLVLALAVFMPMWKMSSAIKH